MHNMLFNHIHNELIRSKYRVDKIVVHLLLGVLILERYVDGLFLKNLAVVP